MTTVWFAPSLFCYALCAGGFVFGRRWRKARWVTYSMALLGAGAVFQALDLTVRGVEAGNIPVTDFAQSLAFLAWLTALAGLVLIARLRMTVLGVFVGPGVLAVTLASYATSGSRNLILPDTLRSVWLPVHVTLAFFGEALFVLAAGISVVYLLYESRLKAKRPVGADSGEGILSLEKLDHVNYRLLGWGFVMLSLAILSGALWADATWGHFWSWEPIESLTLLTWILYAALIESRVAVGWRGRRAAALTIVVFTVLVGSFLGVGLLYPGKHGGSFG